MIDQITQVPKSLILDQMKKADLQSPFDRRSAPVYVVIAAMACAGLILIYLLGFTVSTAIFPQFFGMPFLSVVGRWGLRRIGRRNFGTAMETLGLFYLQELAAVFLHRTICCIVTSQREVIALDQREVGAICHPIGVIVRERFASVLSKQPLDRPSVARQLDHWSRVFGA